MSQYYDSFGNNLIENNVIDKDNEENITDKEEIDYSTFRINTFLDEFYALQ